MVPFPVKPLSQWVGTQRFRDHIRIEILPELRKVTEQESTVDRTMAFLHWVRIAHFSKPPVYGNMPYNEDMKQLAQSTSRLEARLPNAVLTRLKRAAEIQGRTLTDFVVAAADEAACRTIEQTEVLRLSADDQQRFWESMVNPPPPTAAFKKAVRTARKLFGPA